MQFQDELYVIGGSEDQFFSYNIDEDAWKSRANPEFGCADLSVTTIGSHLYAAGRQVESNCINVQRYDHYTDKWTTVSSIEHNFVCRNFFPCYNFNSFLFLEMFRSHLIWLEYFDPSLPSLMSVYALLKQ